ncbi:class I SAM-dependent methyltransferase [Saccharopolyspora taberi]
MGSEFERHASDSPYNAHYDRPAVLEVLRDVRGKRVLDAACGPGLYAEELLGRGAEVVGFDASPAMVELARKRVGDRARIDQARLGEELPWPAEEFDLVLCAMAIHHADDRRAAFAEFHRVLRTGGSLVLSTQHPTMDWVRKGGSYFDVVLETDTWGVGGGTTVRYWREPLSSLCAAATDSGFLIERLVEPRPAESMRERYPEYFERLNHQPDFLVLRLRKA